MNLVSRTITGIIMILCGTGLIVLSFFSHFTIFIYGVVVLILGLFVFFNKGEDKIEQIRGVKKN